MSDPKIHQRLDDLDSRLQKIEKMLFTEKKPLKKSNYSGLSGGMRLLIDNGFFATPHEYREVNEELKREGYHYPLPSISKTLSVDFSNKQKVLTRIKEGTIWKYVKRK